MYSTTLEHTYYTLSYMLQPPLPRPCAKRNRRDDTITALPHSGNLLPLCVWWHIYPFIYTRFQGADRPLKQVRRTPVRVSKRARRARHLGQLSANI